VSVTFVSNALGGTTTTTSFSITLPTTAAGDIIILEFTHRGTGNGTVGGTYSGPAFTLKHSQLYATSTFSGKTYYSRATGNHSGQTVTGTGLTNACAAEITTGNDNSWVVLVVANSPDVAISSQTCTSPGALAERAEVLSTGGTDASIAHASAEKSLAGATGAFTWAQTNGASGSWAYAIRAEPPGAAATDDVLIRLGPGLTNVTGSGIITPSFSPTGGGGGGSTVSVYYYRMMQHWFENN
jgi:hypothetical protein